MIVKFKCPRCSARIAFDAAHVGRKAACPECEAEIQVPLESQMEADTMTPSHNDDPEHVKDERDTDRVERLTGPEHAHDSAETSHHDPVDTGEREPWSILDITRAFTCAGNGAALIVAALALFVLLIAATIFRYIGLVIDRSLTDYIFNGLALLVLVLGGGVVLGTLAKMHAATLTGGKRMSIPDAIAFLFQHAFDFIISPLRVIILFAVVAVIEIAAFYACRFVPYLYGLLFFPLMLLTFVLVIMTFVLAVFIALSTAAVAVDSFSGNGAFEKNHQLLKRKPGRVIGYTVMNLILVGLLSTVIFCIGCSVFRTQQQYFAANILAVKDKPAGHDDRGYDYYNPGIAFLKPVEDRNGTRIPLPSDGSHNKAKGFLFLLSCYVSLAVAFAYPASLFGALNTVAYLALKEDEAEV